jgi:hypothetical protein
MHVVEGNPLPSAAVASTAVAFLRNRIVIRVLFADIYFLLMGGEEKNSS